MKEKPYENYNEGKNRKKKGKKCYKEKKKENQIKKEAKTLKIKWEKKRKNVE